MFFMSLYMFHDTSYSLIIRSTYALSLSFPGLLERCRFIYEHNAKNITLKLSFNTVAH